MLVRLTDEDFPFCSDRCRKIDLGKWAMASTKSAPRSSTPKSSKILAACVAAAAIPMTTDLHPAAASNQNQHGPKGWAWIVATFFGAGYGKPGPGTWGSVAAVLLWAACAWLLHPAPHTLLSSSSPPSPSPSSPASPPPPSWPVNPAAKTPSSSSSTRSPPGYRPPRLSLRSRHALIALLLFRLFDITKPFPARQLESLPGGWGIVFDDVAAGLYAWGIAALLRIWF